MRFADALQAPFARLAVRRPATMSTLFRVPPGFDIMILIICIHMDTIIKYEKANVKPEFLIKIYGLMKNAFGISTSK